MISSILRNCNRLILITLGKAGDMFNSSSSVNRFRLVLFSVLLSLSLIVSPFSSTGASAITYGEEIFDAKTSKPWVASIWQKDEEDGLFFVICTGSLISQDIVLTAAHCVSEPGEYAVQLKADTLFEDGELLSVSAVWSSPRYDKRSIQNDLGLLLIQTPVLDVTPVQVAKKSQTAKIDKLSNFVIYGWGLDQNKKLPTFLRYSKVKQQKKAALKYFSAKQFNVKTTLAVGKYLKNERVYSGVCNGDSGGPLVVTLGGVETLVGVASYGAKSCRTKAPSVFTKISYYERDIRNGVKALRAKAALAN